MQLANTCYLYRQVRPQIVNEESVYVQTNALLGLKNIMVDDILKWEEVDQAIWIKSVEALMSDIKKREKEEQEKARTEKLKVVLADFEKKFITIFEDAKKGSFANVIDGDKREETYSVKVHFSGFNNSKITILTDNIYEYSARFDTEGDKELSVKLVDMLANIIEKNMPEGFEKRANYDNIYISGKAHHFSFKGETFSYTAKRPTVLIGALKKDFSVVIYITEPIFKR